MRELPAGLVERGGKRRVRLERAVWGLGRELASACAVVFAWVAQHSVYPDTLEYGRQFEAQAKAWRPKA